MKSQIEPAVTGPRELRDPRSREYAIQTMQSLKRFLDSKAFDAKHVEAELQRIIQHRHWEVLGFKDLDAYLRAEVGVNVKILRSRLAQDLAADPDVKPLPKAGVRYGPRHSTGMSRGGNNADYLVRRLKRDAPGSPKRLPAANSRPLKPQPALLA